jgi:hypothetical protein
MFRAGVAAPLERSVPTMIAGPSCGREGRATWWKRIVGSVAAAAAGLFAAGTGADASPATVEKSNYRRADTAPATWQAFARQLQEKVEQRLAGDDDKARRFQDYLANRPSAADAPPVRLVLQAWISATGRLHRVELGGINDPEVLDNLRVLLTGNDVGAPPPEMLQPLHLRLPLRANDRLRQEK